MRKRQRKVFTIVVLGLTLILSAFPAFSSFAALPDDAVVSFNTKVPIGYRSFLMPTQSPAAQAIFYQMDPSLSSQSGSSASYLWRLTQYFNLPDSYYWSSTAQALTTWYYDASLDFEFGKVYQFNINIRYSNSLGEQNNLSFDFSKLLLVFCRYQFSNNINYTKSDMSGFLYSGFAPATPPSISGNNVNLTYNVPITPESFFFDQTIEVDSDTGISYVSIPAMGLYDTGTGAAAMYTSNGHGLNGIEMKIFPYNTSAARVFTPSEWSDHVVEQGFNDLSEKIDLSTAAIQDSIDQASSDIQDSIADASSDIINAGDPIDFSDLEDAHEAEHVLAQRITSTIAYTPSMGTNMVNLLRSGTLENGISYVNDWLDYFYQNNVLVWYLFYSTLATVCIYMVFRGVF